MSAESKQPQGLVPGRIVHYVPKERENLREHIVDVWPAMILFAHERVSGNPIRCDLSVNRGGSQDYLHSIAYNADGAPGTWHWMFEGQENRYRSDPPEKFPEMKYPGAVTLAQVQKVVEETMLKMGAARVPEVLKSLGQMEGVVRKAVEGELTQAVSYADERVKQHERKFHIDKIESAMMKDAALPQECAQGTGPNPLIRVSGGSWKARTVAESMAGRPIPEDPWAHRSSEMRCNDCMWYVPKVVGITQTILGRCRRHAPTMGGYPVVYQTDWCGDHKLDEAKA